MEERKKVATKTTHSFNSYNKGNEFRTQYQIAYQFFKKRSKTMLGVSLETGIHIKNREKHSQELLCHLRIDVKELNLTYHRACLKHSFCSICKRTNTRIS